MSSMDEIAEGKERYRRRLAMLSVPEKIRILVELQKRRAPILHMRGEKQLIWELIEVPRSRPENPTPPEQNRE